MAYTTTAAVKLLVNIPTADTDDDALIATLVTQAQAEIDRYCHRTFEAAADTTKRMDAIEDVDGMTLWLPDDLAVVTTVTNGDAAVVPASAYVTEPRNSAPYYALRLKASSGLSWTYAADPEDAIAIVGRWAYSQTVPDAIARAATRLAAYMYNQRGQITDLDRPVVSSTGTVLLPAGLPRDVMEILEGYVRR